MKTCKFTLGHICTLVAAVLVMGDPTIQESVKLASQGEFTIKSPRVNDSLDYVVKLEWQDTQIPVIVLAPDTVSFPGFKVLGQATVHQKLASGSGVRNHTSFVYKLRAEVEGPGKASSMKVRYFTGLSKQEEILFVPTALIDIAKAPVQITDSLWFKSLFGIVLLAGSMTLAWASYRFVLRNRKKSEPAKLDLDPEIKTLQSRLKSTALNSAGVSKEILLDMEKLARTYLEFALKSITEKKNSKDFTSASNSLSTKTFNHLLDQYFNTMPGLVAEEKLDWEKMKDLFRHAHFAGGHKEAHELQDAFRTLKRCLKLMGENEYE